LSISPTYFKILRVRVVVFNTTFNNIWVKSWRSVLLVEKTIKKNYEYTCQTTDWL